MRTGTDDRRERLETLLAASRRKYPALGDTFHAVLAMMWLRTGGGPV